MVVDSNSTQGLLIRTRLFRFSGQQQICLALTERERGKLSTDWIRLNFETKVQIAIICRLHSQLLFILFA